MTKGDYGELWGFRRDLISLMSRRPHGKELWKFIHAVNSFSCFMVFELEDDSFICIWDDVRCGESPLKLVYPELYRIACSLDAFMVDVHCMQSTTIQ